MKKNILLILLFLPILIYAQKGESDSFRKFGVGIGYRFNSVMGDSIRPVEFSVRYRINNKHALQVYMPIHLKQSSIYNVDDKRKENLWGMGLGYDYALYSYSSINCLAGLSADYQHYENRRDFHSIYYEDYVDGKFEREVEKTYFDWLKINTINLQPNIGLRIAFDRFTTDVKIGLQLSILNQKKYAYSKEIRLNSSNEGEMFFPNDKIKVFKMQAILSLNLLYYF